MSQRFSAGRLSFVLAAVLSVVPSFAADLVQVYREALSHDAQYAAARAAAEAGREKLPQTLAGLLPTIATTGNTFANDSSFDTRTNSLGINTRTRNRFNSNAYNESTDLPVVTKEAVIQSTSGSATTTQAEEKSAPRKTAGRGAGVRLTSLDSLKKELLEKPTQEVLQDQLQKTDEAVFDEIDKYAFQQVWKSYLKIIEGEKKQVILKILDAFPPEIVGNKTVLIRVGTESYLSTLNGEREEMYYFLKKELDKKAIDLVIQVDKQKSRAESSRKPYTTGEKFNHMVQKNPKLQELKDRLKLELDY